MYSKKDKDQEDFIMWIVPIMESWRGVCVCECVCVCGGGGYFEMNAIDDISNFCQFIKIPVTHCSEMYTSNTDVGYRTIVSHSLRG